MEEEARMADLGTYLLAVAYDVASDKRRRKLVKQLERYGQRVQESVFECRLTKRQAEQMAKGAAACIRESEDSLRIYVLGGFSKVHRWGGQPVAEDLALII